MAESERKSSTREDRQKALYAKSKNNQQASEVNQEQGEAAAPDIGARHATEHADMISRHETELDEMQARQEKARMQLHGMHREEYRAAHGRMKEERGAMNQRHQEEMATDDGKAGAPPAAAD